MEIHELEQNLDLNTSGNTIDTLRNIGFTVNSMCSSGLKPKSCFNPNTLYDNIEAYHSVMIQELIKLRKDHNYQIKDNLTHKQCLALQDLIQDASIVIKPSDKGGNLVLWDVNDYKAEAMHQLADSKCCEIITWQQYDNTIKRYHEMLYNWWNVNLIDDDEFKFLKNDNS